MMKKVSLNGAWECMLPQNEAAILHVPGCWDISTRMKSIGTAVTLTKSVWINKYHGKRYFLYFGAVSYYCDCYVNSKKVGSHEGMWDSFRFDVTDSLVDGDNRIHLDVIKPGYNTDDRFPVREVLSGFIPDVLCTFGGIWDDVWLEECDHFLIASHYAKGDMNGNGQIYITADLFKACDYTITADIYSPQGVKVLTLPLPEYKAEAEKKTITIEFALDDVMLWDIENPNLYSYTVTISCNGHDETIHSQFGFREITYKGSKLLINNSPVYARGILHWGCYDEAIIPNPSEEVIRDEIEKCKQLGFNMIKHCLYIPREEYFRLADQNGVLLWIELPLWLPEATPELHERIRREYPRILDQIAGHPSIVLLSLGCELDAKVDSTILEEMYGLAKSSGALIRDNSGSGECYDGLKVDYADFFDYHFYGELQNMENLMEVFTPTWRSYRPWFFGEFCDSDTMRDLKQVRKKRGVDQFFWELADADANPIGILKPDFYLDKHDERMEESGIRQDFELIHKLSVNHSLVHRKTTLEYTRAFPEISGYNITSIRDVPIATSGLFDDCMEPKFEKNTFMTFNSDIVLVPAWDLTRVWINADRVMNKERYNFFSNDYYGLHILLSNYSQDVLEKPKLAWELISDGSVCLNGEQLSQDCYQNGEVRELGYISFALPEVHNPETMVLKVTMACGQKVIANAWPVFVYPKPEKLLHRIGIYDPANLFSGIGKVCYTVPFEDEQEIKDIELLIASRLTPKIREYVKKGGKVFFVQRGEGYLPSKGEAFWREGMIRCYEHPVLNGLEYEQWFDDLRFFSVTTDTVFDTEKISSMPFDLVKPMIRRYDCRKWQASDYMLELNLGKGTIIASTLRFEGGMGKQPSGIGNNKFGLWLFHQTVKYFETGENQNG